MFSSQKRKTIEELSPPGCSINRLNRLDNVLKKHIEILQYLSSLQKNKSDGFAEAISKFQHDSAKIRARMANRAIKGILKKEKL